MVGSSQAKATADVKRQRPVLPHHTSPRSRRPIFWGLALVAAFVGLAGWSGMLTETRDRFIPKRWGAVEEGKIYRSGQLSRHLVKQVLREHQIQTIVDLTFDDPADINHEAELAAIAELGIERRLFPLYADGTGDAKNFAAAVQAVVESERDGKRVLVHCAAGTQRTGSVIALYRLLVQHRRPEVVMAELKKYRYDPVSSPKLRIYLNSHIGQIAEELARTGTIASVPDPLPRL